MFEKKENDKRVIVITGTSRGIGRGVAEHFLSKGWTVEGCTRGAGTITDPRYHHTQVNVADEESVRSWIRAIKRRQGKIDVLLNNAGLAPAAIAALLTPGSLVDDVLKTNVMGSFLVAREVALVMTTRKYGRIINVSSMAVGLHEEGTAIYSASKSAIVELTRILAKELAPFNITCNVIAPSMFMTKAVEALGQEVINRALSKLTIKRTITMEEICHVLGFLVSPLGGVITGQTIHIGLISG